MLVPLTENEKALVEAHIGFARKLATRFLLERPSLVGVELDELCSIAMMGLCDAVKRFDPSRTESFRTFSYLRVRGAMFDYLRKEAPMGFRKRGGTIEVTVTAEGEQPVTTRNSETLNPVLWTRSKEQTPNQKYDTVDDSRLENPIYDPAVDMYGDETISPEQTAISHSIGRYLSKKVDSLPEKERQVLEGYYFDESTLKNLEVRCHGLSRSWLSRLHSRGLRMLKESIEADQEECILRELVAYQSSMSNYSFERHSVEVGE